MSDNGKIISALLIGAAAGATLGILFAPDKGSATRKKISGTAEDLINKLSSKIDEGREALSDLQDKATSKAEKLKNKVTGMMDEEEAHTRRTSNSHA